MENVHPWDNRNNNTRDDLRQAMAQNPYLNVMFQSGYYDGATTYFNAKYTMWQLDPSGRLKDRLEFHGYRSGHMMYLRKEDLETSNQHIKRLYLKIYPKRRPACKILICKLNFYQLRNSDIFVLRNNYFSIATNA